MSGAMTWDIQQVDAFKKAFGARNKSFLVSLFAEPYEPDSGYRQAKAMLDKRQALARQTFSVMVAARPPGMAGDNPLIVGLRAMETDLQARSGGFAAEPPGDDLPGQIGRMIALTDEWIAFEARSISAGNEMAVAGTYTDVRRKLALRVAGLSATLAGLRTAPPPLPDLRALDASVAALSGEARNEGRDIRDAADFAKRLEECTRLLREAAAAICKDLEEVQDDPISWQPSVTSPPNWRSCRNCNCCNYTGSRPRRPGAWARHRGNFLTRSCWRYSPWCPPITA
jgi:hypothetical protein